MRGREDYRQWVIPSSHDSSLNRKRNAIPAQQQQQHQSSDERTTRRWWLRGRQTNATHTPCSTKPQNHAPAVTSAISNSFIAMIKILASPPLSLPPYPPDFFCRRLPSPVSTSRRCATLLASEALGLAALCARRVRVGGLPAVCSGKRPSVVICDRCTTNN